MRRLLPAMALFLAGFLSAYVFIDSDVEVPLRAQGPDPSQAPTPPIPRRATADDIGPREGQSAESVASDSLSTSNGIEPTTLRPVPDLIQTEGPVGGAAVAREAESPRAREPGVAELGDASSDRGGTVREIPLADGLELDGDLALLHERLQNEERDTDWSSVMEIQLLTYFAARPALAQNFALPVVACRQSGCEVQAIGYGPESFQNWQTATADLGQQPWAQEFAEIRATSRMLSPGVQGIVTILLRTVKDPTLRTIELPAATS